MPVPVGVNIQITRSKSIRIDSQVKLVLETTQSNGRSFVCLCEDYTISYP